MHIYSEEDFLQKQAEFVIENIMNVFSESVSPKNSQVIKNYVYSPEPVRIN